MDTRNNLVPKHSIATESELAELVGAGFPIEKLPKISSEDPAIKELNVKEGDVIRIDRVSPVTKEVVPYYRVVE